MINGRVADEIEEMAGEKKVFSKQEELYMKKFADSLCGLDVDFMVSSYRQKPIRKPVSIRIKELWTSFTNRMYQIFQ